MHGAGNDFILFYNLPISLNSKIIKRICDRHFGIGADGVLIVENSSDVDFDLKYFNSDGTGDVLCVNGARCAVWFAYKKGLCGNKAKFKFINKIFTAEICDINLVKVLLDYQPLIELNRVLQLDSQRISYHYVDIGAKHVIIDFSTMNPKLNKHQIEHEFEIFDVFHFGKRIRNHSDFSPYGTNVNFVLHLSDNNLLIRTYEKGVENETLACGSGSISAALVTYLTGQINPPIKLKTKSTYVLEVNFDSEKNMFRNITLTGPAHEIYEGIIDL